MSDNAGVETGKIFLRIIWWFIKLIPNIIKGIIRGVKHLINMLKKKVD